HLRLVPPRPRRRLHVPHLSSLPPSSRLRRRRPRPTHRLDPPRSLDLPLSRLLRRRHQSILLHRRHALHLCHPLRHDQRHVSHLHPRPRCPLPSRKPHPPQSPRHVRRSRRSSPHGHRRRHQPPFPFALGRCHHPYRLSRFRG